MVASAFSAAFASFGWDTPADAEALAEVSAAEALAFFLRTAYTPRQIAARAATARARPSFIASPVLTEVSDLCPRVRSDGVVGVDVVVFGVGETVLFGVGVASLWFVKSASAFTVRLIVPVLPVTVVL